MQSVYIDTPFCVMKISAEGAAITEVDFFGQPAEVVVDSHLLEDAVNQVASYMRSGDFVFQLPLQPSGTDFQRRVWQALQQIPAGRVKTYGQLAAELGSSPRAVGNACRRNPIPLFIPCHRVVSANGLGGFAGDVEGEKIRLKSQLLAHEGVEII